MNVLKIYSYNNYFNRIIKKSDTLTDYGTPEYTTSDAVNFEYNDGVTTSQILNYGGAGDYLIVVGSNSTIESRWFIIENKKIRGNQYQLELRRDLIADFYNRVVTAPMIIDRAMITDANNALLFNPEGFSFNQIKSQEILLKDETWTPWYILYFNKNVSDKNGSWTNSTVPYDADISVAIDDDASPFKPGTYTYIDNQAYKINYNGYPVWLIPPTGAYYARFNMLNGELAKGCMTSNNYRNYDWFYDNPSKITYANDDWVADKFRTAFSSALKPTLDAKLQATYEGDFISASRYDMLKNFNQSIVVKSTVNNVTKYYQVNISLSDNNSVKYHKSGTYYTYVTGLIDSITGLYHNTFTGDYLFETECNLHNIRITATEINVSGTVNWKTDFANHVGCKDAPYHIIAIPKYSVGYNVNYRIQDSVPTADTYLCPQTNNEALVDAIINAYASGGELVDVQLLPYFPYNTKAGYIANDIGDDMVSNIDLDTPDSMMLKGQAETGTYAGWNAPQFQIFGDKGTLNNVCIFYLDSSDYSFDISKTIAITSRVSDTAKNKKLSNELDLYKIVSPNYNGEFEYSNAKNNGTTKFNVDMTLKPYNPYIHINPVFKGLYGDNYKDNRGLICQGDFSLPIITDQWKTYELNNKNYQNIFNRQLQHMDFTQEQERIQSAVGLFAGTATGAVAGSLVGSKFGNPAVGAIAGGTLAAGAGIADYAMLTKRQNEEKSLALDNYNYQLGNIKALPNTVSKVTCLTANNKIWPFIEIYKASEAEEQALMSKIEFLSMKVDSIGKINDYLTSEKNFIQGKIIRLEDTGLANNEVFAIYDEIKKGVYI